MVRVSNVCSSQLTHSWLELFLSLSAIDGTAVRVFDYAHSMISTHSFNTVNKSECIKHVNFFERALNVLSWDVAFTELCTDRN